MRDQNEFMRQMLDLVEFAKTNENRITKEQVDDFCQDMKLQKSQLKLVYEFLEEHHIEVEGVTAKETFQAKEGKNPSMSTKDSQYLTVYRRELRELEPCSDEERQLLYERLLAGEAEVSHRVVESHLQRVVTLAAKYKNRGVSLEDLIQAFHAKKSFPHRSQDLNIKRLRLYISWKFILDQGDHHTDDDLRIVSLKEKEIPAFVIKDYLLSFIDLMRIYNNITL